ncbi:MAG: LPP20 family lipoprotein [Thermodesulfovibrionales bacterium]
MKRTVSTIFVVLTGLFLLYGCGGSKEVKPAGMQPPEWVIKGSGAFGGERGKVFYGVSSAYGIKNFSLLRSAADNRARNEVAKIFQFYSASLMKDYMASTMAGDPNVSSEEQHVEQAVKTVTSMTLSGVEIVDHWQHPETGELFALARLDLEAFKNNMDKAKELNRQVRDYIRQNADRLHGDLEEEEEKMRER